MESKKSDVSEIEEGTMNRAPTTDKADTESEGLFGGA